MKSNQDEAAFGEGDVLFRLDFFGKLITKQDIQIVSPAIQNTINKYIVVPQMIKNHIATADQISIGNIKVGKWCSAFGKIL